MRISTTLQILGLSSTALAQTYSLAATIPWAPKAPSSVDQSQVYNQTYYLADRTNACLHVVSLVNNTQITCIPGFVTGLVNGTLTSSISGADGVLILRNRDEAYVGDGDGSVKVINLLTNQLVANISTGSKKRADELAYNPTTQTVIVANPNEVVPMITVINAATRKVMGNITFPGASGIEQPTYNPADGLFYISIPSTTGAPGGAVQVIDVNKLSITKTLPLPMCAPAGIVFGPTNKLFIGCSSDQVKTFGISASYILDVTTGAIVANVSGVTGSDQVAYSQKTGYFYASAYLNTVAGAPAPLLAVISATGMIVQKITTDNVTAHAVAVDEVTGNVVVPVKASGILVYSMMSSTAATSTSAVTSATSKPTTYAGGAGFVKSSKSLLGLTAVGAGIFAILL